MAGGLLEPGKRVARPVHTGSSVAPLTAALVAAAAALLAARLSAAPDRAVGRWVDAAFAAVAPVATAPVEALPDVNDGRSAVSGRWRASLARFAQRDAEAPPPAGGIVFVGSSSISQWDALESQFAPATVVGRGLGGARMADCLHHLDRLVLPYRPRLVIVYAGDNDLAEGVPPEAVLNDYIALVQRLHDALPQTRVAFLSIKLSPSREALAPLIRRTNALIADHAQHDSRLGFIDVHTHLLDAQGHARSELFRPDGLHPNAAGYAVWRAVIADHLR